MKKALITLSGGQDSAVCAAWASIMFDEIRTISFDYGQRHKKELYSAAKISERVGAISHNVIEVPSLKANPKSCITNFDLPISKATKNSPFPTSFVPGRNLIFLTSAASYALGLEITNIVTGVCQTEYSGYPDCRHETIKVLEKAIQLGIRGFLSKNEEFHIHTPLMYLTKCEAIKLAQRLPLGMELISLSWSCYEGEDAPCKACPACVLRNKGFKEAGIKDPASRL